MSSMKWAQRSRNYALEKQRKELPREEAISHPLKGVTVTVTEGKIKRSGAGQRSRSGSNASQKSSSSTTFTDPLSAAMEGSDPLSLFAAEQQATDPLSKMAFNSSSSKEKVPLLNSVSITGDHSEHIEDTFEPWSSKKIGILSKFTTSEKLSIATSFLSGGDKGKNLQPTATVSDKVKHRLEQLDDFEEGSVQEMLNLSQQDYVHRIDELNSALIEAWEQDQRVKALKIAIQCAKLLADVSVMPFYPSKFVLITDILETFGRLVFDRIKTKSTYLPKGSSKPVQLPDNFTPDQVPESAKETCRNWFFKIASIRELVPRFYVEAAILKCYSFLTSGEYSAALTRLADMTRGVGDPLVALYTRCFLCRVGVAVAPHIRDHLMPSLDDTLFSFKQISSNSVQKILSGQKLDGTRYMQLYTPALDWILQCVANKADNMTLNNILEKSKNQNYCALLIHSIISVFRPEYVASRALEFTAIIKDCDENIISKHLLYRSLGSCLSLADPPDEHRLTLLNDVWKIIMKLTNPGSRELNTILADIIKHMTPDRAYEDHYPQLLNIITKIMAEKHDFSQLFSLDKFLPFIDMFQKESVKVDVCRIIMEAYVKHQGEPTNDPVILNALMFICKTMHDSVNALTLDDEIRATSNLIVGFIRSISFGQDFEQQLNFYVEARAAFSNIDSVMVYLIQSVDRLAMQTREIMKGNHSRKTAAFVRACAAYSFIAIPSLNSMLAQLNLYLVSGRVAIINQCLSQGDAFFKAAISLMSEIPKSLEIDGKVRSSDGILLDYMNNFISTLLVIPDNPDQGVLYLLRGLLNVTHEFNWDSTSDGKFHVFLSVVVCLSAMLQDPLIYTVDKVDSNDKMYGGDPKFVAEVKKIIATLLDELLTHIKSFNSPETYKRRAQLSYQLFSCVVAHADLADADMMTMAQKAWQMSQRDGQLDTKLSVRTINAMKQRGKEPLNAAFATLASSMHMQSRT